jgi:hypothetical protein
VIHDFKRSLAKSHRAADLPIWEEIYRRAFHDFAAMVDHRADGEHQRAGIDRSIILANSKQLLVDEKIREVDYGDILLEHVSNDRRGDPGWVCKPLRADYIAYAVLPSRVCYLLPVPQLQQAWRRWGSEWLARYRRVEARNAEYLTLSCPVPVRVLFSAIGQCLRVSFSWQESA